MSVNLTDSQEIFLEGVRTDFKIYMMKFLKRLNDRPENQNIPTFADVEWRREANKMLHTLADDVKEVKDGTKKNGNMLKSVMSVFSFAGGEAKRHKD